MKLYNDEIQYGSYEFWQDQCRYVVKGEKALLRSPKTDIPLFAIWQTEENDINEIDDFYIY